MKTAEEWVKEVTPLRSDLKFVDQIRQIQLDAMKEGAYLIALMVRNRYLDYELECEILSTAEQWEPNDL